MNKKGQEYILTIRNEDRVWTRIDEERAEITKNLSNVFQPFTAVTQQGEEKKNNSALLESLFQIYHHIKPLKVSEGKDMIHANLNPKRAYDLTVITIQIIKELPEKALTVVNQIFKTIS